MAALAGARLGYSAARDAAAGNPPRTLTVAASGICGGTEPCFTTIQAAIDAAEHGDTIEVLPGIYSGPIVIDRKAPGGGASPGISSVGERLVIRRAPGTAQGTVLIRGGGTCTRGVVQIKRSHDVTLRGFAIEADGSAIELAGRRGGSTGIHIEQNVLLGNASCSVGVRIARGRDALFVNNQVAGFGRDGIRLQGNGGRHWLVQNTVHANGQAGVAIGHECDVRLIDNAIARNGRRLGAGRRVSGIRRVPGGRGEAEGVLLVGNVVCGNRGAEVTEGILDPTDASNRTPSGAEGPGVLAAGESCADELFVDESGDDGVPGTSDDDRAPADGSALVDGSVDPTKVAGLAGVTGAAMAIAADLFADGVRPQDGDANGQVSFDAGAIERRAVGPTPTPQASPSPEPSTTPEATPTPEPPSAGA